MALRFLNRRTDSLEGFGKVDSYTKMIEVLPESIGIIRAAGRRAHIDIPHCKDAGRRLSSFATEPHEGHRKWCVLPH